MRGIIKIRNKIFFFFPSLRERMKNKIKKVKPGIKSRAQKKEEGKIKAVGRPIRGMR
jgi:hypothetical protein